MPAPIGNQFYLLRHNSGRKKKFETAVELEFACQQYFDYADANPIMVDKSFHFKGQVIPHEIAKPRALTISGMALYLNMDVSTWRDYKSQKDFSAICNQVETQIYNQKFAGASADTMNPAIIARELGLADSFKVGGDGEQPIKVVTIDEETYLKARAKVIELDDC